MVLIEEAHEEAAKDVPPPSAADGEREGLVAAKEEGDADAVLIVDEDDDSGGDSEDDGDVPKNNYSSHAYWDDRYGTWAQEPFDWLFEWRHVEHIVERYVKKDDLVLIPGCGNAPFSPDMYDAGYVYQVCLDTSTVVVEQMMEWHNIERPKMRFYAVDCRSTEMDSGSYDAIIDKSLIDTLRCCDNNLQVSAEFITEMYRLLKPHGLYMTFSLHTYSPEDLQLYYDKPEYDWKVAMVRLANPHFKRKQDNAEEHTLIVCAMKDSPYYDTIEEELQQFTKEQDVQIIAGCLQAINSAFQVGSISENIRESLKDNVVAIPTLVEEKGSKSSLRSICKDVMHRLETESKLGEPN